MNFQLFYVLLKCSEVSPWAEFPVFLSSHVGFTPEFLYCGIIIH